MPVGLPAKTTYVNGDVFSASDINDTNGTLNITAAPFAAGKNKIINGDFYVNQRNFTSNTTNATYNFDRWFQQNGGGSGTLTITPQTFTAGTAPVAGYEGRNFVQCVTASGAATDTYAIYTQKIEDVRTAAGQTVTISFWAKANSGTPKIAIELEQFFGSGGSPSATVNNYAGQVTLSTSWVRQSLTYVVPSLSGKTIGTTANTSLLGLNLWLSGGSAFNSRTGSLGLQNNTFQIWGVQLETAPTATGFQTATGTIQGELAACQRYYQFIGSGTSKILGIGYYASNAVIDGPIIYLPVEMRTTPTISIVTGTNYFQAISAGSSSDNLNSLTLASESTTRTVFLFNASEASGVGGQGCRIMSNNAAAFLAVQAEL